MNNLRQLILSYNRFIDDLKTMNDDLMNEIEARTGLTLIGQYWQPRDRSAWSPKNRFYTSYKSSDNQFLINAGFLLDQSIPSFFISRVDFKTENKEKANWIYYLARNFGSKFIILKSKAKDKGFKRKTLSNIKYIETFLKGHDVDYEIVTSTGKQSFKKEIVSFAKEHQADLILAMATRDIKWVDYMLGAPEQYIIANPENLPVMCLNPKPAKLSSGFRAAGGS